MGLWREEMTIETAVPVDVLQRWLAPYVVRRPPILFPGARGPAYSGSYSHQGFELRRIIGYRNSFRPVVRGVFRPNAEGTTVDVTLTAPVLALVVFAITLPTFLLAAVVMAVVMIAADELALLAMPIVFVALPTVLGVVFWLAFKVEVNRSRRDISLLMDGRPPS